MWDEFYQVACQTAVAAGQLLEQKWRQPRQLTSKGFRDIVTDADIAAQTLITDSIRTHFPNHGFLTEEEDLQLPIDGDYIWIIDPLDGTSNYSRQLVNFSVSIAMARKEPDGSLQSMVGVVYDPLQHELFSVIRGQSSWYGNHDEWQTKTLMVADTKLLEQAIFSLDWSHGRDKREQTLQILHTVAHEVRTVRGIGSAALAMAWIAAGRLDAYLNLNLYPWDIAAGSLLIQQAGGIVSTTASDTWNLKQSANLATNGHLHKDLHTLIQQTL
jgi:myo-inositol-1(or 4)-monophosphatase